LKERGFTLMEDTLDNFDNQGDGDILLMIQNYREKLQREENDLDDKVLNKCGMDEESDMIDNRLDIYN
jgi:hypothetical protein